MGIERVLFEGGWREVEIWSNGIRERSVCGSLGRDENRKRRHINMRHRSGQAVM